MRAENDGLDDDDAQQCGNVVFESLIAQSDESKTRGIAKQSPPSSSNTINFKRFKKVGL